MFSDCGIGILIPVKKVVHAPFLVETAIPHFQFKIRFAGGGSVQGYWWFSHAIIMATMRDCRQPISLHRLPDFKFQNFKFQKVGAEDVRVLAVNRPAVDSR